MLRRDLWGSLQHVNIIVLSKLLVQPLVRMSKQSANNSFVYVLPKSGLLSVDPVEYCNYTGSLLRRSRKQPPEGGLSFMETCSTPSHVLTADALRLGIGPLAVV